MKKTQIWHELILKLFNRMEKATNTYDTDEQHKGINFYKTPKLIFITFLVIEFGLYEAFILLLRKNHGSNGLNFFSLVLSVVIFLITGFFALYTSNNNIPINGVWVASLYFTLVLFILIKGYNHLRNRRVNTFIEPKHEGDSHLQKILTKTHWSVFTIQMIIEPFSVIIIGCILTFFIKLYAIPIILCGFSVWVYHIITYIFSYKSLLNK